MLDYAHSRREALADAQSPANQGGMESKAGGQLRGLGYAEQVAALAPSQGAVQCKGGGAASPLSVQQAAAQGVTSGGGAVPYQAEMETAFGTSFAGVKAHTGGGASGACASIGAEAYASGDAIAFGSASPSKSLVAHELTHVVQQRAGVQLSGGVGQVGDSYEQQADTVASQVTAGQSVAHLFGGVSGGQTSSSGVQQKAVQCFRDYNRAGETDDKGGVHWKAAGSALRVAEDGTMAIAQDSIAGSQEMYIDSGRVATANADLAAATAPLRLTLQGGSVSGGTPNQFDKGSKTLKQVIPVEAKDGTTRMTTPDDCGNAARTVTGAVAEGKQLKGSYQGADGAEKVSRYGDPALMKYEIMVEHFAAQIPDAAGIVDQIAAATSQKSSDWEKIENTYEDDMAPLFKSINQIEKDYMSAKADYAAISAGGDAAKIEAARQKLNSHVTRYKAEMTKLNTIYARKVGSETVKTVWDRFLKNNQISKALVAAVFAPYEALAEVGKLDFDRKVGINRHADPGVGESYTISSGGDPMKDNQGDDIRTWNFHWGGVILKSTTGSDNVTMENYAGNREDQWYFQMYGVPTPGSDRAGQTFQDIHKDTHRQHGQSPTTISTEKA